MNEVSILIVRGVEGDSVYIDNHRVCGPKPWGGGKELHLFKAKREEVLRALHLTEPDEEV